MGCPELPIEYYFRIFKSANFARYDYSPDGQLNSILKPVSDSGAVKQSYFYSYKGDGIKEVSVYKKFIENSDLAKLNYQVKYGAYQVAVLGNVIPSDKKDIGQLIERYCVKGVIRLNSEDALGNKTEYKYNKNGQLVTVLSNGELQTNLKYDNNGHVIETEDILGRTTSRLYDPNGRIAEMVDPLNEKSEIEYDRYGRIVEKKGAGSYPLSFSYNSFGEITSYTDSNCASTGFKYDSAGHLVKRIWPDGSQISYSYDSNGLIEKKVEADRTTVYSYDNMNRMLKIEITQSNTDTFPVTLSTNLKYNISGNLIEVSDESGKIEFNYDDFGRIVSEKGLVGEIKYSYNAGGLLSAKLCVLDGKEFMTEYFYNELNRVAKVSSPAGEYVYFYDKNDRIVSLSFGDVKIANEYDKAGRLTAKKLRNAGIASSDPILLCSYEYDALDRRIKASFNGVNWIYGYDKFNQLTSASSSDGKNYGYNFDLIGNRISDDKFSYAFNSLNQVDSHFEFKAKNLKPETVFFYDKYGNLIKTQDSEYKYDLRNRLVEVKKTDITVIYSYDPLGQRIKSKETKAYDRGQIASIGKSVKTTLFLMHGMLEQARVTQDFQPEVRITQFHTFGLDLTGSLAVAGGVGAVLASTTLNDASFNYLYDGNGNVIATCDSSGAIAKKIAYSPFGEIIGEKPEIPFAFSTKPTDASALVYYGFRFYNAELGKWLSRDPVNEKGGYNIYEFCNNNPIDKFDALGNLSCTVKYTRLAWLSTQIAYYDSKALAEGLLLAASVDAVVALYITREPVDALRFTTQYALDGCVSHNVEAAKPNSCMSPWDCSPYEIALAGIDELLNQIDTQIKNQKDIQFDLVNSIADAVYQEELLTQERIILDSTSCTLP